MTPDALLDTNVILRFVLNDNVDHSPRAKTLMETIERGTRSVRLSDTVIFETVFTLSKTYGLPRPMISNDLLKLLDLPGIVLPGKRMYPDVFDRWVREPSLSFADSYHLSLAKHLGLRKIISFDRKIAKDPAVTRVEP